MTEEATRYKAMDQEAVEGLWTSYQDAWADVSAEERERLLRATVSEAVVFTNPVGCGKELDTFLQHVAEFQPKFPGAYFRTESLLAHNDQLLAAWTMYNRDGSEALKGHSFARVSAGGKLEHLAGFWKQ